MKTELEILRDALEAVVQAAKGNAYPGTNVLGTIAENALALAGQATPDPRDTVAITATGGGCDGGLRRPNAEPSGNVRWPGSALFTVSAHYTDGTFDGWTGTVFAIENWQSALSQDGKAYDEPEVGEELFETPVYTDADCAAQAAIQWLAANGHKAGVTWGATPPN